ncbi:MAG: HEAT repeat domain-containing protein [Planctomycetota bacterium]
MGLNSGILLHLSAFNDRREGVRVFAARRLATYGAEAAPILIELLGEEEGCTRDCAALALKEMGAPAIHFLSEALQSPKEHVREQAAAILSSLREQPQAVARDSSRYCAVANSTPAS